MIVICPTCGAKNRVEESRLGALKPVCGKCRRELPVGAPGGPVEVTDRTFESVLAWAGDRPVLVDCWAPWCGPCRMIAPVVEQLAAESDGRWVIAKLNTDENQHIAGRFNISAIPTLLIFLKGRKVDELVGLQPREAILERLRLHAGR